MCQVKPKTLGSSTRSIRMSALSPLVHVIWGRSARAQLDRRPLVTEPGTQTLGRGERGSDFGRRVGDLDGPLDAIGESHDSLQWVATIQLLATLLQPTGCVKSSGVAGRAWARAPGHTRDLGARWFNRPIPSGVPVSSVTG